MLGKRPPESLANYRWVGPMPDELKNLTWIEELLIARAHVVGRVVRLQARNQTSHFAVKGHVILLPQDTTLLLNILPMTPASLPDVVRVVWTGKSAPDRDRDRIRSQFTVRREIVYNALQWLCRYNEDYRQVTINHDEFARWPPVFVATTSLLDSIGRSRDSTDEDISRSGFATEDIDTAEHDGDLPLTTSAILDTSEVSVSPDIATLRRLAELKDEITVNVVTGSTPLTERDNPSHFTSAFPTIRPAQGPSASASPYVQLSRVPSLGMVFILRPFDSAELRRPLSDDLLAELAWEDEMAEKTKRLYGM